MIAIGARMFNALTQIDLFISNGKLERERALDKLAFSAAASFRAVFDFFPTARPLLTPSKRAIADRADLRWKI